MVSINDIVGSISKEVSNVLTSVDSHELMELSDFILKADTIFVQGNGRSGLVGKMFAMRLMHSGYNTYVVGETTTPNFTGNDLLIVLSGSGYNASLKNTIDKVHDIGGRVALVTATDDGDKRKHYDSSLHIGASTKNNDIPTIQPLGSQFDQSMHLVLDALIVYLNEQTDTSHEDLKKRHFNLE